jgi:hypothetical protein
MTWNGILPQIRDASVQLIAVAETPPVWYPILIGEIDLVPKVFR